MRKTSLMILLAGFVFIYFTLPFSGIDLLIDAVGFLLIRNGLRGLQKTGVTLGPAVSICLVLVAIAAGQLFVGGIFIVILAVLRAMAEASLLFFLMQGLLPLTPRPPLRFLLRAVFIAAMVFALSGALFSFLPSLFILEVTHGVLSFAVPAVLLVSLLVFSNTLPET